MINLLQASRDTQVTDGLMLWAFRGFIVLCMSIIAYFLKRMVEDSRAADNARDGKIKDLEEAIESQMRLISAHDVMYDYWLENLTASHPEDGNRKTDEIHRLVKKIAEAKLEGG